MVIPDNTGPSVWLNVLYLVCRYMHLVGGMLLVGGILFYETVVPIAIADLKAEVQLAIFARARWVFRWLVWSGVAIMVLTGVFLTMWKLHTYIESEFLPQLPFMKRAVYDVAWPLRTGWWWAAHVLTAVVAMLVASHMVAGDRPPRHPVSWLRLDLMLLLIVVFFASVTRQVDQIHQERAVQWFYSPLVRLIAASQDAGPATQPAEPAEPDAAPLILSEESSQPEAIRAGSLCVPLSAIDASVSRSSGPGGQNVNKQNTRIELRVPLAAVEGLTDAIRQRLRMLAGKRLSTSGELRIVSQQTRSLEQNRAIAVEQLRLLLEEASHLPRKRHATRPTRASRRRRIEAKRRRGEVKSTRRAPPP